jgi:hypothetical protein
MPTQDFQTNFRGIIVRVDPEVSSTFLALVNKALNDINSQPVGQGLLNAIVNSGEPQFGYKVCIMRSNMVYGPGPVGQDPPVEGNRWMGGSRAKRANEDNACNGRGTVTRIDWNPNVINTPDGSRPSFIGLAHELVHALRNLLGTASSDPRVEEESTVGLNGQNQAGPNENMIRQEHGVPRRAQYTSDIF